MIFQARAYIEGFIPGQWGHEQHVVSEINARDLDSIVHYPLVELAEWFVFRNEIFIKVNYIPAPSWSNADDSPGYHRMSVTEFELFAREFELFVRESSNQKLEKVNWQKEGF